jgi:hypothetical protein
MDRRRFLKVTGLAVVGAGLAQMSILPSRYKVVAASAGAKQYRGDRQGRIYVSVDGGTTWRLHTSFGSQYSIDRLETDSAGRVRTTIGFHRRQFGLVLGADERSWRTV